MTLFNLLLDDVGNYDTSDYEHAPFHNKSHCIPCRVNVHHRVDVGVVEGVEAAIDADRVG